MAQPKITDGFPNFLSPQDALADQLSTDRERQSAQLFQNDAEVNPADGAAQRGRLQFEGAMAQWRLRNQFLTFAPTDVTATQQAAPQEQVYTYKVSVPASGDAREIRDALLRDNFNFTDADIAEFDRETNGTGFRVEDSAHPGRWATPDEVKSWKTENGQTTITVRESLARSVQAFRERRAEALASQPIDPNLPPATFDASNDQPRIPESLRFGGQIGPQATPDEAAAFITEKLRFSLGGNVRESQTQFFVQALRDHANDPAWTQNFFRALGSAKTAELIGGAAEPGTYQYFDEKQINEHLGVVRNALSRMVNAGRLNRADMNLLLNEWTKSGRPNPWVATEIFAKAPSENVKNLFASAAAERALQPSARGGNELAAAATQVLASTSPQNQARQVAPLINSGNFDRFMLQARAGENELPTLASVARGSSSFGAPPQFEKFGRSAELLQSLRGFYASRPDARPLVLLSDEELATEYRRVLADRSVPPARVDQFEDEFERRTNLPSGVGASALLGLPREPGGNSPYAPANTNVSAEVAARILENVSKGEPPFKPELGKGGVSWFVASGDPYTSVGVDKPVQVPAELKENVPALRFGEQELAEIYNQEKPAALRLAEEQYRARRGLTNNEPLSRKGRNAIEFNAHKIAENAMWDRVAQTVRTSESGVGRIELKNSRFSRSGDGEFTLVRDASNIRVRGGIPELLKTLGRQGVQAEPVVVEAAEAWARKMEMAGKVRGVFRVGGRILIVVGLANDAYKIYTAQDKVKAVVESAGGWAGAVAAGSAFATWFAPADAAGPWAWAAHGVGTLVAGGVGYWVGSETTRTIYELVVEEPK
jgi:hypothetical protein